MILAFLIISSFVLCTAAPFIGHYLQKLDNDDDLSFKEYRQYLIRKWEDPK
jgi:hypothetical protein